MWRMFGWAGAGTRLPIRGRRRCRLRQKVQELQRRREHSLDVVVKEWLKYLGVSVLDEG